VQQALRFDCSDDDHGKVPRRKRAEKAGRSKPSDLDEVRNQQSKRARLRKADVVMSAGGEASRGRTSGVGYERGEGMPAVPTGLRGRSQASDGFNPQ
jgi:hypothetical protein